MQYKWKAIPLPFASTYLLCMLASHKILSASKQSHSIPFHIFHFNFPTIAFSRQNNASIYRNFRWMYSSMYHSHYVSESISSANLKIKIVLFFPLNLHQPTQKFTSLIFSFELHILCDSIIFPSIISVFVLPSLQRHNYCLLKKKRWFINGVVVLFAAASHHHHILFFYCFHFQFFLTSYFSRFQFNSIQFLWHGRRVNDGFFGTRYFLFSFELAHTNQNMLPRWCRCTAKIKQSFDDELIKEIAIVFIDLYTHLIG